MEISHLRAFLYVYKTGSFSQAAKLMYRSQPAVSLQIKEFEGELGSRLFERFGPMKVKPTAEGIILERLLSPILQSLDNVKRDFETLKRPEGGQELSIATHEAVLTYFLPDFVQGFIAKYPETKFSFLRESKENIVKKVLDGEADLGITTLDRVPRGLVYRNFAEYKRVLICPKRHALTKLKSISPKNIAQYPLILPPPHSETRNIIDEVFTKAGVKTNLFLELAAREAVKIYVSRGFGVSILNDYYLFNQDLKILEALDVSKYFGVTHRGLLFRKGKIFSKVQNEFVQSILDNTPLTKS